MNSSSRLPLRRIHRQQEAFLVVPQREHARRIGAKQAGSALRRAAAHQHRRVVVVTQADCMTKLVSDHIARDIWEAHRWNARATDSDGLLAILVEWARERHELRCREDDRDVAR